MRVPRIKAGNALSLLRSAWSRNSSGVHRGVERALDATQRETLLHVLRLGCPRSTAAKRVGLEPEQLEATLAGDAELLRKVLRAEADAEVRHMANIHHASSDEKNWRTSMWWWEQRGRGVPEGGAEEAHFPEAVQTALDRFAALIVAEIPDVMGRQALMQKLLHISRESVEPPVVIDAEGVVRGEEESPQE
jgi:hypothetical protein